MKYVKPSSAFVALEECDEKYRAVIAEPRVPRDARSGKCLINNMSTYFGYFGGVYPRRRKGHQISDHLIGE